VNIYGITNYPKTSPACRAMGLIVGLALISPHEGFGQGAVGGRISGRVTDPSDAVIPNATISAQSASTNGVIKSQTNGSGYYDSILSFSGRDGFQRKI
jgi:hypothetical protein